MSGIHIISGSGCKFTTADPSLHHLRNVRIQSHVYPPVLLLVPGLWQHESATTRQRSRSRSLHAARHVQMLMAQTPGPGNLEARLSRQA
eukprot:278501-Rhodomonas_salina.1